MAIDLFGTQSGIKSIQTISIDTRDDTGNYTITINPVNTARTVIYGTIQTKGSSAFSFNDTHFSFVDSTTINIGGIITPPPRDSAIYYYLMYSGQLTVVEYE